MYNMQSNVVLQRKKWLFCREENKKKTDLLGKVLC